jgi:hypothetical protein
VEVNPKIGSIPKKLKLLYSMPGESQLVISEMSVRVVVGVVVDGCFLKKLMVFKDLAGFETRAFASP